MAKLRKPPAIIPSLDLNLEDATDLLSDLADVEDKIAAYKVSSLQVLEMGLEKVLEELRAYTSLPLIYDHQKACTDIPAIVTNQVDAVASLGIDSFIAVPQGAGSKSLENFVKASKKNKIIPVVLLEMTHPGANDYLKENTPSKVFDKAVELGVKHFVVPGNKTEKINQYRCWADKGNKNIRLLSPGIGAQGGTAEAAVKAGVDYPIIGRAIYTAEKPAEAVQKIYDACKKGYNKR
ncbi:MAG: orotidine 5'-phosphate decarboxylase / HUMPS family protein [Candidatus Undinarchaeales archaeon]